MKQVYLAGTGLACGLGLDMSASLAALRSGGVNPTPITVAADVAWPVFTLPAHDGEWLERTRRVIRQVAHESLALADRSGPLFLASSSLDIGWRENTTEFGGDIHEFAERVGRWLDWRGQVFTVSTACTSGTNALLSAAAMVRSGEARDALVLGVELANRLTVAGFGAMRLLSPDAARPFGAARDGLVLGEAVAALHLSSVPARWRIAGGANVVDGRDPAGALAAAIVAMCEQALQQSGLDASDIHLIKPQAAGGCAADAIEAGALKQVFDPLPPLVSLKASIGHTLGASGVAEIALLTGCLESGAWPSVSYLLDDALEISLSRVRPAGAAYVLACNSGLGGGYAAAVLEDGGAR